MQAASGARLVMSCVSGNGISAMPRRFILVGLVPLYCTEGHDSSSAGSKRFRRASRYHQTRCGQTRWTACGGMAAETILPRPPCRAPSLSQEASKGRSLARARFPGCAIMTAFRTSYPLTHALAYCNCLTPPLTLAEACSCMLGQRRCHVSLPDAAATSSRR